MTKNDLPVIAKAKAQTVFYNELFGRRAIDAGYLNVENTQELVNTISQLLEVIEVQREALNKIDRDAECWSEMIDIAQDAIAEVNKLLGGSDG